MARILVLYGTAHGHTGKVAAHMADTLRQLGHDPALHRGDAPPEAELAGFDGYLLAASIIYGRHQRYMERFARRHAELLGARPSAFLSVCGAIMGAWAEGPRHAARYLTRFVERTGWRPDLSASVAGALAYTRYRPITRWIMRLVSRRTGRPTDTSRDYEFTDWAAVDAFARRFAELLPAVTPGGAR